MSADNGIYIFRNLVNGEIEYKVSCCSAIENIFDSEYGDETIEMYFGTAPSFSTEEGAREYAGYLKEVEQQLNYGFPVEYGIQVLPVWDGFKFKCRPS